MRPLDEFLINYDEEGSRTYLWKLAKSAVTGEFGSLPRRERTDLMYFYEQLDGLLADIYKHRKETAASGTEGSGNA
ncbi:hypothetical protein [Pararcticibacter amylolyticus]|uniref:Uncharacterized protein n=1 Tax=Pararcticibacter amylolyticus TaxID=2173175 RepID=A0A2U2PKR6_9SPHI|nr:hypothetical protein [Pararcticibacter amylolyticus]PWG81918.1 hypothetical protein DDR33_02480 [Pararcticibacter amylolyticus]